MDNRYDVEFFTNIVKTSNNISDVSRKLNLSTGHGNRQTIQKYIKLYNIDISHFHNGYYGNDYNFLIKRSLSEYLVENSTFCRMTLKKRLYKEGLKERKCELCGQGEDWNGKHMSLILDHINGVNNDNRLENLRIVCPNCNATLDTHCRGKYKLEKIKQKQLIKNKKTENEFYTDKQIIHYNKQRKVERPPYEQLIKEISELGYRGTGRKYSVSDSTIRKWKNFYEKLLFQQNK
jgi:hypothetical protein